MACTASLPLRGAPAAARRPSAGRRFLGRTEASGSPLAGAAFAPASEGSELLVPVGQYCEKHYQTVRRPTR